MQALSMRVSSHSSLIRQVLFSVVAASLLMFSAVSALTALHERNRMFASARADAREMVARNLANISRDLWNYDVGGLTAFLRGLEQSGSIVRAEVLDGEDAVVNLSRLDHAVKVDHSWSIDLMAPDNSRKIGELRISESYDELRKILAHNLLVDIASELVKIGGLAAFLVVIVHRLVTRHLKSLATEVEETTLREAGAVPPISLHRKGPRRDELDTLVDAINRFRNERAYAEEKLMRDISVRKRVEAALQKSEASLSEALKISRLGYWEYDVAGNEFSFNDQYYSLHRTSALAMGGYHMAAADFLGRLIHPEDASVVSQTIRTALGNTEVGSLVQAEARIVCADGEIRWVLMRFKAERDDDGHAVKLVGANQDITERKIVEQQIHLMAQLTTQKEAAELANQAKSRFLAAASHDLRQPVHALHLFLGTLRNLDLPQQAQRPLANVLRCTESIDEMFVALLDVSKLDAGLIEPQVRDFPVITVLNRIRHECEPQAQAKGLGLRVVPCSAWTRSDPLMVERILRNLVTNAIRYTTSGHILVGCRRAGNMLRLAVLDTGAGIAPDQQDKIFGEFYKAGSPEPGQPGLGLGLSIVDRLAKLLSAPIKVASTLGKGSTFSVDFPRTVEATIGGLQPNPPFAGNDCFDRRTVLVVDDDHAILEATRGLLEQWGCTVLTAETVAEALERAMAAPKTPDAVVCDYRLRGIETGTAAIAAIREEFNMDIPALLITGDTSPQRIRELKKTGLPVLHKPLREGEFREAVAALLSTPVGRADNWSAAGTRRYGRPDAECPPLPMAA